MVAVIEVEVSSTNCPAYFNSNGIGLSSKIKPFGTDTSIAWYFPRYNSYELIEVQAPEGYVLAKEPAKFKVDGSNNGLIEIRFEDKSQKGIVALEKTGQTAIDVTMKESDYGKVHEFVYEYKPIADVTYRIEAVEDILPQGKYYLKELDAGSSHVADDTEYDFEFTAENNHATFPIHIYQDTVAYGRETMQKITRNPILNKLHFNEFRIKKVNETAHFDKETGIEFTHDALGTGAVFALENKDGEVLQEVTITKDGLGVFKNIPVGTFYLKETASSSDQYLVSKDVIRIESTKEGIKAFNAENKVQQN